MKVLKHKNPIKKCLCIQSAYNLPMNSIHGYSLIKGNTYKVSWFSTSFPESFLVEGEYKADYANTPTVHHKMIFQIQNIKTKLKSI